MKHHKKNIEDINEQAFAAGEAQLKAFLDEYGKDIEDVGAVIEQFRKLQEQQGTAAAMSIIASRVLNDDAKAALIKAFGGDKRGAVSLLSSLFGGSEE